MASGTGRLTTTIIGSGNVAWGLAPALQKAGVSIRRIVSRSQEHAETLAKAIGDNIEASADMTKADHDVDIVIVAASDNAIASIAASCPGSDAIWLHTSGSVDTDVLAAASTHYGALYPMQTFTRGQVADLSDAAVFVEGSDEETTAFVTDIARRISRRVRPADSRRRRQLHCAAVFACNFTNHLWDIADGIATDAGSSIDDFFPLIDETLRKARTIGPHAGQTGPASRGAEAVMQSHENLLGKDNRALYHLLSESIAKGYEQD